MSKSSNKRTPEVLVERLAVGELSADRAADVRARLTDEDGGEARLEAIKRSNEAVLEAHPPAQMAREIELRMHTARVHEKANAPSRPAWPAIIALPAAVAVAVALFFAYNGADDAARPIGPPEDTVRLKGEARLEVFRVADGRAQELAPDDLVGAGEVLQLGYVASGKTNGVLVSIDGNGSVTLHFPSVAGASNELSGDGRVSLPHGYELDDAPAFERFFFVTSDGPIATDEVLGAARRLARTRGDAERAKLELPEHITQDSFLLRKRP